MSFVALPNGPCRWLSKRFFFSSCCCFHQQLFFFLDSCHIFLLYHLFIISFFFSALKQLESNKKVALELLEPLSFTLHLLNSFLKQRKKAEKTEPKEVYFTGVIYWTIEKRDTEKKKRVGGGWRRRWRRRRTFSIHFTFFFFTKKRCVTS